MSNVLFNCYAYRNMWLVIYLLWACINVLMSHYYRWLLCIVFWICWGAHRQVNTLSWVCLYTYLRAAGVVTPLTFRGCQHVGSRKLRGQMTGGRAERLRWNENGSAWTAWRQNVSRGRMVQRAQARDAVQMPLLHLNWSAHSMSQRVDPWLGAGERGGCFSQSSAPRAAAIFFFFLPDNGRWECLDISGGLLRAWTCHTKFNSVTLRLWLLPCITCECVFSLSLLGNLYAVKTCSSMLLCLPSQRSPEFAPIKHHYSD